MLTQWYVKDPSHSKKRVGGRLHLNIHIPFTQRSQSGLTVLAKHSVETFQGIELPSDENTELKVSPFKAWSRSVYIIAMQATLTARDFFPP